MSFVEWHPSGCANLRRRPSENLPRARRCGADGALRPASLCASLWWWGHKWRSNGENQRVMNESPGVVARHTHTHMITRAHTQTHTRALTYTHSVAPSLAGPCPGPAALAPEGPCMFHVSLLASIFYTTLIYLRGWRLETPRPSSSLAERQRSPSCERRSSPGFC